MKKVVITILIFLISINYTFANRWNDLINDNFAIWDSAGGFSQTIERLDLDLLKKAIENGADLERVLLWLSTLSYEIKRAPIIEDQLLEGFKLVFSKGAEIQGLNTDILASSISSGSLRLTKLLIDHGADVNSFSKKSGFIMTPVEMALAEDETEIAQLLINSGAAPPNNKLVLQEKFFDIVKYGSLIDLILYININKGVSLYDKNKSGQTVLGELLERPFYTEEMYNKLNYLVTSGVDINQETNNIYAFPLHIAIYKTSFAFNAGSNLRPSLSETPKYSKLVLLELIDHGAFVSKRDSNGLTPLHVAAKFNNSFATKLLLENYSKVMSVDNYGKTPLDYAESGEIIKLLKEYGATE